MWLKTRLRPAGYSGLLLILLILPVGFADKYAYSRNENLRRFESFCLFVEVDEYVREDLPSLAQTITQRIEERWTVLFAVPATCPLEQADVADLIVAVSGVSASEATVTAMPYRIDVAVFPSDSLSTDAEFFYPSVFELSTLGITTLSENRLERAILEATDTLFEALVIEWEIQQSR
jgi:hypothetical protein